MDKLKELTQLENRFISEKLEEPIFRVYILKLKKQNKDENNN